MGAKNSSMQKSSTLLTVSELTATNHKILEILRR